MQTAASKQKLAKKLSADTHPLDYSTSLRILRNAIRVVRPAPVVVAEGANTMDNARSGLASDLLFGMCADKVFLTA